MVEFQQGLLITAIGMGLVFVVIILLWGLMALMMRVTSRNSQIEEQAEEEPQPDVPVIPEMASIERQKRAAAAAVAVQLAMAVKTSKTEMAVQKEGLSPWQTVHRLRQLEKRTR
jgi:sodium pump decarboxylase gamma subunit